MKLMAWSEHFVTGIEAVDAQHHALVDMINVVAPSLALGAADASRVVSPLLDKLIHYAAVHFKYEEDLMTKTQVLPDYLEQHHRTHQAFVDEVLQMRQQYEQAGNVSGQDMLQFLTSWLSFHILSEDKRMASQVQAIQNGDTADHAYASLGTVGGAPNAVYTAALIDLFSLLSQRNRSLLHVNQQLVAAQAELEAVNRSLEARVAERTQALLQAEKMAAVGQLAAGVAHEINNPIGFISSNMGSLRTYVAQLLELVDVYSQASVHLRFAQRQDIEAVLKKIELTYLRQDVKELIEESQAGLARVKRIVCDLRNFSQVNEAELQTIDINAVLQAALNVVDIEIKSKAELIQEIEVLPEVPCIGSQLKQVLVNLLLNAVQSISGRGTITVRSGHNEQEVWIEISDTGCGMTDEVKKRIFEPFYTTQAVGKGTGLGLSMSWEIMQRHQGKIAVQSSAGIGSTFRISLPKNPVLLG
jgi:hemerythrin-like metal-binding protein